jgi:hypothetical protein
LVTIDKNEKICYSIIAIVHYKDKNMTMVTVAENVKNLTGSNTFDRIDSNRGTPPLTYVYLPARTLSGFEDVSVLKFQGELPPAATPRTRGAQQWAQRRAGRQANLLEGGRLILEEADYQD